MIDFHSTKIQNAALHYVGNKLRDEGVKLGNKYLEIGEESLDHIKFYFLSPFKLENFFEFHHPTGNKSLNDVFNIVRGIFENQNSLLEESQGIAKLLYHVSSHPKIKGGHLYVAYLKSCNIDNHVVDGIGLFKSEREDYFLKNSNEDTVWHEKGINIKKLDKGCLILNIERELGYKVLYVDSSTNDFGTQYWKDGFLGIQPCINGFHMTNNFLSIAKDFVSKQLPNEFEIDRMDQADLLNKAMNFFKENDQFDREVFMNDVFKEPQLIDSFHQFENEASKQGDFQISDQFDISNEAVKKKVRVFKSVLKLDKNFHVYIHGNREMIEKGVDKETGKKYYKIYYEEEN